MSQLFIDGIATRLRAHFWKHFSFAPFMLLPRQSYRPYTSWRSVQTMKLLVVQIISAA
jgi:hypothetical protein